MDAEIEGSSPTPPASVASVPIDAHLPRREVSKPLTMLLLLNRGCNLRCVFCDLWDRPKQMELPQLLPLLDDARSIGTKTLVITGGEPFLHKDLFAAVREARARGLAVNITTNGTLVERRWEELQSSGVNSLSFSLDGLSETHDRLRGRRGCFQQTLKALERVQAQGDIATSVYFVVTADNVRELIPLFDLVRSTGAGFDFWPVNDAPDLAICAEEDKAIYREAVRYIGRFDPAVADRAAYYDEGLAYHAGKQTLVRCLGLVDQFGVTYDGHLLPCCVWGAEGIRVGNVFQTPLVELWTTPEVQKARERLFHSGCNAGCFNHSLYEFTQSTGLPFRLDEDGVKDGVDALGV
jgi:MoaA/NifB/PqqE/SkfB family radical SAM enzyme